MITRSKLEIFNKANCINTYRQEIMPYINYLTQFLLHRGEC